MDGRSLLPVVRGEPDPRPDDVLVQISESQVGRALRTPRWKYAAVAPGADGWNTPAADRYVDEHLYDLEADPYELHDLVDSPEHTDVLARLRARLVERIVAAGEARPVIEPRSARPREEGAGHLSAS
jgi:arylsulfatase A-like enzyme